MPLYTTFYHNLEKEYKKFTTIDIFCKLQKCKSFYDLFKDRINIFESFTNFKPSNVDNKFCAAVFLTDNYSHNYLSILNNLAKFSKVSNLYIFTTNNIQTTDKFISYCELIREKQITITTITIQDKFTFNDYNNLMLDTSFWNIFNFEYIVLFSTLSFLKRDLFDTNSSLLCNDYFMSNNQVNYSFDCINTLFSVRSKKYMIELIKQNSEMNNDNINKVGFTYKTLNIRNPIEHVLFKNNINKNINGVYLEGFEKNNITYLDNEYKLIDILLNIRC